MTPGQRARQERRSQRQPPRAAPGDPGHPTRWSLRSEPFAAVCPAPFFAEEVAVPPGGSLSLRYSVVIADGIRDPDGAARLAEIGAPALMTSPD